MSKTIKYTGTQTRWSELSTTGKQAVWQPGQQDERSDSEAALLLAAGVFQRVYTVGDLDLPSLVSGAGISLKTLAEMLAWAPADGTSCYVTDLYSGVRGLFTYNAASSKWRPAAMVLVDRSLTLDSGVNSTAEQYIKSLSIPAGLLFTGCEIMFEYSLARSNTTDAGAAANFRVGNAGTVSDTAFGNGSGFVSFSGSVRSFGNMHRYRVVSATQIEKLGAASTAGTSFAAAGSSVVAGAWTVGDTTQRLYFAPTVQLAAATGSTLPQVGYCALWLLPS